MRSQVNRPPHLHRGREAMWADCCRGRAGPPACCGPRTGEPAQPGSAGASTASQPARAPNGSSAATWAAWMGGDWRGGAWKGPGGGRLGWGQGVCMGEGVWTRPHSALSVGQGVRAHCRLRGTRYRLSYQSLSLSNPRFGGILLDMLDTPG